jgi:hypothetical protein
VVVIDHEIRPAHELDGQGAAQRCERAQHAGIVGDSRPQQDHRVVARQRRGGIVEHHEVVGRDPAVAREPRDDIDLPACDGLVEQGGIEARGAAERQPVRGAHRGPLAAAEKLVVGAQGQRTRVPGEIAEPPQAEPGRRLAPDGERVSVLEAERAQAADALVRDVALDLAQDLPARRAAVAAELVGPQRPRVVDVGIERAAPQRIEHDIGPQALDDLDRDVAGCQPCPQQLCEDVLLGEALGAHADVVHLGRPAGRRGRLLRGSRARRRR